jgi:hypothetical protein
MTIYEIVKEFYTFKNEKEILQTNNAIKEINRYTQINYSNKVEELKAEVRRYGSKGFMRELMHRGIVVKARGYCNCNGGTWSKKGE